MLFAFPLLTRPLDEPWERWERWENDGEKERNLSLLLFRWNRVGSRKFQILKHIPKCSWCHGEHVAKKSKYSLGRISWSKGIFDQPFPTRPNSNPSEFYVHFKCFRDPNASVWSFSPNSKSKILDTWKYADSDKTGNQNVTVSNHNESKLSRPEFGNPENEWIRQANPI